MFSIVGVGAFQTGVGVMHSSVIREVAKDIQALPMVRDSQVGQFALRVMAARLVTYNTGCDGGHSCSECTHSGCSNAGDDYADLV